MSKLKIILIILLIIAIGLLVAFWFLSSQRAKENQNQVIIPKVNELENETTEIEQEELITEIQEEKIAPAVSEEEKLKAQLAKLVTAFAERYGSYSNQSDYENLEDLAPFMSERFKNWTVDFINTKRAQAQPAAIYYGVTTKALNTEITDFSLEIGQIKFKVSTQKQEMIGNSLNAKVYYQDLELGLIKEGGLWVVGEAVWK